MKNTHVSLTPEVIAAINGELTYQFNMSNSDRTNDTDHGVAGQLVTLDVYAQKANEAWVNSNKDETALDNLRKVAAIAVRALVLYGCPTRDLNAQN